MMGFITERNLREADEAFPGIARFFESLEEKPTTFLALVSAFEHWADGNPPSAPCAAADPSRAPAPSPR